MAPQAPPLDPIFGILYGIAKIGKTTDLLYSFPRAVWAAAPGATAPAWEVCGYRLPVKPVDLPTLDQAEALIHKVASEKPGEFDAIVFDDIVHLVDRTIRALAQAGVGSGDPRQLWGAIRLKLLNLRDTSRRCKIHVFLNAHEAGPKMQNGTRIRGGPALPGAGAEIVPSACDIVLRATPRAANVTSTIIGWPVVYRCNVQDLDYISGDRYNRTPDQAPMNIGEIVRSAGFKIRRAPGLEWQEEIVEKIAGALVTNLGDPEFTKRALAVAFAESMKRTDNERHAIWVQRDAYDRAVLSVVQASYRRRLFG